VLLSLGRLVSMVLILVLATPIAADATTSDSGVQRHCIAQAKAAEAKGSPTVRCYSTFAAAISAATSGRVKLKDAMRSRKLSADELQAGPASPLTTYVLSVDYKDANFSGSTLTWSQSSPCGFYQAGSMPSGWNDVVSSVADYSGCATTLYHDSNFKGTTYRIGVNGSASSLGSFNDQTSSQKWCPVYPCV
jgi:hypothetical protein